MTQETRTLETVGWISLAVEMAAPPLGIVPVFLGAVIISRGRKGAGATIISVAIAIFALRLALLID